MEWVLKDQLRSNIPEFRSGDTVRVHAKIVEGTKERIQVFEGVVIKRHKGKMPGATFTVRKVSYNIGVERTFLLHSPRIDKIEIVSRGITRRARLFHLRPLRGKAARIKTKFGAIEAEGIEAGTEAAPADGAPQTSTPQTNGKQADSPASKASDSEQGSAVS